MISNISERIIESFAKDVADRYDIPELLNQKWRSESDPENGEPIYGGKVFTPMFNVQPRGQLAGFVKDLTVKVTLQKDDGVIGYEINFQYNHIDPGSNGKKQTGILNIYPQGSFNDEEYLGFIDYFALRNLIQHHGKA